MMENNPAVTVIIPTYNNAHFLDRAIQSALNQTYQSLELILVDDCSSDNTEAVVNNIKDKRIRYIKHTENKGGSAARNTGIKGARGDFIAFLDSDDEWLEDKLYKQVDKFLGLSEAVAAVYTGRSIVSEATKKVISESYPAAKGNVTKNILQGDIISLSTIMIRKKCFKEIGLFDEGLPAYQDQDLWLRLAEAREFDFVPEILVKKYVHKDQVTADLNVKISAHKMILKKHRRIFSRFPFFFSNSLNRLAELCCLAGSFKEAKKYLSESISIRPFQRHGYMRLLMLILAPRRCRRLLNERLNESFVDGVPYYW